MLYPGFSFVSSTDREDVGFFVFDQNKKKPFGPYQVGGWHSQNIFKTLDPNQALIGIFTIRDGTDPITAEEHHERLLNGEDYAKGEYNIFVNALSFGVLTFESNIDDLLKSRVEYEFLISEFFQSAEGLFAKGLLTQMFSVESIEDRLGDTLEVFDNHLFRPVTDHA